MTTGTTRVVTPEVAGALYRTYGVYVDGRDVSLELIKAGLAWLFTGYSSDPTPTTKTR